MFLVHVAIHLELRRKEKAQRLIDLFSARLGSDFSNIRIETHHEDPKVFRATFDVPVATADKERAVYYTLVVARTLETSGWLINGPHDMDPMVFECYLDNSGDDQPLKWGHVELLTAED